MFDYAEHTTKRRPCPKCDGGLPVVNPFEGTEDGACPMCGGTHFVFENCFCKCGRPAVYFHEGSGKDVCVMDECWKLLDDEVNKRNVAGPIVPNAGRVGEILAQTKNAFAHMGMACSEEDWSEGGSSFGPCGWG